MGKLLRRSLAVLLLVGTVYLIGRVWRLASSPRQAPVRSQLVSPVEELSGEQAASGFARAEGPQPIRFPEDHGPHPDYQTEWWYYTGNLQGASGRRFGYQLTFFRRALLPPGERQGRPSDWATEQVFLAHFAVSDISAGRHQAYEKLARGAAGLAGAQAVPFQVWLEDWGIVELQPGVYNLKAAASEGQLRLEVDLLLRDVKGPVLQGEQGFSPKGPTPGQASYYISQTRLETSGTIGVAGQPFEVHGSSWMDHEYSTSALADDQVGWDWFALQFDDGRELMVFEIRKKDGSRDPFSSGNLVGVDGQLQRLEGQDFEIEVLDTWRSPSSKAEYPARWRVSLPAEGLQLLVEPLLDDQELDLGYVYWEGAVRITGEQNGRPVSGYGYVELTGYAGAVVGEF